jgi:hypothetical protein
MAVVGFLHEVGPEATVCASGSDRNGSSVLIQNPEGNTEVYVGGSDVTDSLFGYVLLPGRDISIDIDRGEEIYLYAADVQTVHVLSANGMPK